MSRDSTGELSSEASHWQAAQELFDAGQAFIVVTMIACRGHVPQDVGAKAIVTKDGLYHGTIGGGKVEAKAISQARELLNRASAATDDDASGPRVFTWNLTTDVGMTCGGEVTFLFETHDSKRWSVAVFGAGHVAQALIRTLQNLDCHITCLDGRAEWLDRLPESKKITKILSDDLPGLVKPSAEGAASLFNVSTFFIVMTQGHASDLPVLEKIYRHFPEAPYVGVMGSDVKARKMRNDLIERGLSQALVQRLHSPIGLRLGRNQPYEIAISVVAELLQARDAVRITFESIDPGS